MSLFLQTARPARLFHHKYATLLKRSSLHRTFSAIPIRQQDTNFRTDASVDKRTVAERMSLKGKTTVITGGARGIGLALAEAIAQAGGDVAILDILDKPEKDIAKFGVKAKYYRTDVTKLDNLEQTFTSISKDFGNIHGCVPAAGITLDKPFLDHNWDECQRILSVNLLGLFFTTQLATRAMLTHKTPSSIVLIASIASHRAIPLQHLSFYGASKGAVRVLMTHLAVELAPHGIRVNSISPGFIRSAMTEACAAKQPELFRVFGTAPPLGRIGEVSDLTGAVCWLLSEAAGYTTGADVPITGGLIGGRMTH